MKDYKKDYAILLYHEDFLCRNLNRRNFRRINPNTLGRVREKINQILFAHPDAGKIWLHNSSYYKAVR